MGDLPKKQRFTAFIMLLVGILLAGAGWHHLPDILPIRIDIGDFLQTDVTKLAAILVPAGLTILGILMYISSDHEKKGRGMIFTTLGYIAAVLCLVSDKLVA